jgi:diazepam-binding inhibitor (GABA receptor modulating acyl-CoA-binding protein)
VTCIGIRFGFSGIGLLKESENEATQQAPALQTGADFHLFAQVSFCCRVCATTRTVVQRKFMSASQDRFAQAQEDVNGLAERPDNNTMLKLYALYKQATQGDAAGERPGGFDFVRRAKFDAWSEIKGTSAEDAMQQYIDLVASLRR